MKTIYLDSRETDNDFIAYLADKAKEKGYNTSISTLEFGDINFQNIYIERKTSRDFCSSVCEPRLWEQAAKMEANKDYTSIIIISGTWNDLRQEDKEKIPRLEGSIIQLLSWGIPTLRVKNDEELVDLSLKIFEHSKPMDIPIKHVEKNKRLSLFMALPSVGAKAAKKLIAQYDNMAELCTASKKDLQSILGPKKGSDVFEALRK
jgi:ERCC4-type nuclease